MNTFGNISAVITHKIWSDLHLSYRQTQCSQTNNRDTIALVRVVLKTLSNNSQGRLLQVRHTLLRLLQKIIGVMGGEAIDIVGCKDAVLIK